MGFRRNIGATRTCRVNNGYIELKDSQVSYPTTIPVNTDWQCNMYESPIATFVLITPDAMFVGAQNGSVGKYTHDGLLLALYTWDAPHDGTILVGYCNDKGRIREARVFSDERNIILIRGSRKTFRLQEGFTPTIIEDEDSDAAYILRSAMLKETGLHVELEGGGLVDELKHGYWETDPSLSSVPTLQL